MKMRFLFFTLTAGAAILLNGCTDLKDGLPPPEAAGVQVHHPSWNDTTSANFHGLYVKEKLNGDLQSCLVCHGQDYNGGTSKVSCITCHEATSGTIHGKGWEVPGSPNFHGKAIAAANWDMRPCQTCHGPEYAGGRIPSSCRRCHTDAGGPENCATCHGTTNPAPPRDVHGNTARTARGVGAHQIHYLGSSIAFGLHCGDCHQVPGATYDPGHIDATPNAEVVMNTQLALTVTNEPSTVFWDSHTPLRTPAPTYNAATLSCANTYCHGYFKNGNLTNAPVWTDVSGSNSACGSCHGDASASTPYRRALPKTIAQGGTHPDPSGTTSCGTTTCHIGIVDANFRILDPTKHMNGKLDLGGVQFDF